MADPLCLVCREPFAPRGFGQLTCSKPCAVDYQLERNRRRSARKHPVRARTLSTRQLHKRDFEPVPGASLVEALRPKTRGDCANVPRPCPFVSCRHHLYLDVSQRTGSLKINFPDLDVTELGESCSLDVAGRGGTTLEDVGAILNLTRERIRQTETAALVKLAAGGARVLREFR